MLMMQFMAVGVEVISSHLAFASCLASLHTITIITLLGGDQKNGFQRNANGASKVFKIISDIQSGILSSW